MILGLRAHNIEISAITILGLSLVQFFSAVFLFPLRVSVLAGGDLGNPVHSEGVERLCHEIHPQRSHHRIVL